MWPCDDIGCIPTGTEPTDTSSRVDLSADSSIELLEDRESSSGLDSEPEESSDHSPEGEDMELSYASSIFSGNHGSDHVHEPEGIHPFLYEPIAGSSSSSNSSSDESEASKETSEAFGFGLVSIVVIARW